MARTTSTFHLEDNLEYLHGFNGYHKTEAASGAVPEGHNTPQTNKYGLYSERLSGPSFTTARKDTKQSFLYRLRPSAAIPSYSPFESASLSGIQDQKLQYLPSRAAWAPPPINEDLDFVHGLVKIGGAGDPGLKDGLAYYSLTAGKNMPANEAFSSSDGDLLLVAQQGTLDIRTELGRLRVRPCELVLLPRGIKFQVTFPDGPVRAYGVEVFGRHFDLPELGPIGAYGLANVRDFQIPTASFDDSDEEMEIVTKAAGRLYKAAYPSSIFNVVGWHGTSYPYKYDLGKFNVLGSISYDHPDPSSFTVLTCPSSIPSEATIDIAVFAPRWLVMEDCLRVPWFHQNTMSELAFLVKGGFETSLVPRALWGYMALINPMVAHGANPADYAAAAERGHLPPEKIGPGNLGVMFVDFPIGISETVAEKWKRLD